jgi:Flp pilus assembly protein TadG
MRRTRRGARGQGLAEFALIFPIFILLLVVVFDFGRAIYAHHTIANAARGGARVAIVDQNLGSIRATALAETVGLNPDDISVDLTALTTSCVTLKIGCEAEVTVIYNFQPLTPIVGNIIGPMTLSATTRFPIERVYTSP